MKNVNKTKEKKVLIIKSLSTLGIGIGLSLNMLGCTKTSSSLAVSSTPVVDSINTVDTKLQGVAFLSSAGSVAQNKYSPLNLLASFFGVSAAHATPFDGLWDQPGTVLALDWQQHTIKEYLGIALRPDFVNPNGANDTVFGRFRNAAGTLCALDLLVPKKDANGLPADGTYNLNIQVGPGTLLSAKCKGFENAPAMSMQVTMTVAASPDTTHYDKAISLGNSMPMYIRVSPDVIRIESLEVESGRDARNRMFVEYNKPTDILRFEYMGQGFDAQSGDELDRIFINGPAHAAFILSHSGIDTIASPAHVRFSAAGSPTQHNSGTVALSFAALGQQLNSGADVEDLNACINAADGSVNTDDSLNCQVQGIAISTATGIAGTWAAHATSADITVAPSMTVPFTDQTDMYTAISN